MATGREHWNAVYDRGGETEVSWFERQPESAR
jgi:hypothetical protein